MKFQVGDKVKAFGVLGTVTLVSELGHKGDVVVAFENGNRATFELDGKYLNWHKEPSLILVERPKRTEKRKVEGWLNIYDIDMYNRFHSTKERAERYACEGRIACVKVTGEYEVDVE